MNKINIQKDVVLVIGAGLTINDFGLAFDGLFRGTFRGIARTTVREAYDPCHFY